MTSQRRNWSEGVVDWFEKKGKENKEMLGRFQDGAHEAYEDFTASFRAPRVKLPKTDLFSGYQKQAAKFRQATTERISEFYDATDEGTRFYVAILLPTLVANYFFGRYFAPLTAFLTKLQGVQLYRYAGYKYEEGVVKFDNTILTYGTDYIIGAIGIYITIMIFRTKRVALNKKIIGWGSAVIISYALSTLAGAVCHNFLSDIDSMNTITFRMIWRICVGSVGAAGGLIGAVASNIGRLPVQDKETVIFNFPVVPDWFWICWSGFFFAVIWFGLYSMTTPACDIFLAGVTQTIPHFYFMMHLICKDENHFKSYKISNKTRNILLIGLLLNIQLLPGYDLFTFLKLPLGLANLIMHANLTLAFSSQGYGIYKIARGIALAE